MVNVVRLGAWDAPHMLPAVSIVSLSSCVIQRQVLSVNTLGLRGLLSALAVDVGALELVRVAIISLWVPRDAYCTFAICLWHFLGSLRALVSAGTNAGVIRVLLHTQQTLSIY